MAPACGRKPTLDISSSSSFSSAACDSTRRTRETGMKEIEKGLWTASKIYCSKNKVGTSILRVSQIRQRFPCRIASSSVLLLEAPAPLSRLLRSCKTSQCIQCTSLSPASRPNMSYTSNVPTIPGLDQNSLQFTVSQVDIFIFTSPRVCGSTSPSSVVSIDHALHDFSGLSRRVGVQLQLQNMMIHYALCLMSRLSTSPTSIHEHAN